MSDSQADGAGSIPVTALVRSPGQPVLPGTCAFGAAEIGVVTGTHPNRPWSRTRTGAIPPNGTSRTRRCRLVPTRPRRSVSTTPPASPRPCARPTHRSTPTSTTTPTRPHRTRRWPGPDTASLSPAAHPAATSSPRSRDAPRCAPRWVSSTGHRDSGSVDLLGGVPAETAARHLVEPRLDRTEVVDGVDAEVGAFADVAAQQPVAVLVGRPLPR